MGLFGYKKEKVEDGLRRSTRAVLIGGLFHPDHVEKYNLNKEASSWFYSEMLSHLIFCIGVVFNHKISGKKSWATQAFMQDCIKKEIEVYESENSQPPGTVQSIIFKRLYEIEKMSAQERSSLAHIKESASRIKNLDKNANQNEIENLIEEKTREFINILLPKF